MRATVSGTTRKICKIDTGINTWISQKSYPIIYYSLSCWNFTSVSFIRVTSSTGFVNAWSKILPESKEFQTYGNDSLRILYNYYGSNASNEFQGCFTKNDRLSKCSYNALQLEFGGFKTYVNKQKIKIKEENLKRYSLTKSKLELKKGDKYATKNRLIFLKRN